MNRYPVWKYIVIAVALLFGATYTAPNFFGEAPAVQISSQRPTVKVDAGLLTRIETSLKSAGVAYEAAYVETVGLNVTARVRLADTDTQIRARDALETALNPDPKDPTYVVALSLLSRSPRWLASVRALPMYLGLDLRGGVHFLMQVNTAEAVNKRLEALVGDLRTLLREKDVRHAGITRAGERIEIRFREAETRTKGENVIRDSFGTELALREDASGTDLLLVTTLSPAAAKAVADSALKQNITTLHNRINELGVAEPVIQQQGADRVVVQLPGVQDTARAKDIIGRTATLEARLVDFSAEGQAAVAGGAPVPFGSERFTVGRGAPVVLKKEIIFSGQQLQGAQATFDENQRPAVSIDLNESAGPRSRWRSCCSRRAAARC